MLLSMIFYLMGVKVNCYILRADPRPWCRAIVAISDKTVHLEHIVCTKGREDISR